MFFLFIKDYKKHINSKTLSISDQSNILNKASLNFNINNCLILWYTYLFKQGYKCSFNEEIIILYLSQLLNPKHTYICIELISSIRLISSSISMAYIIPFLRSYHLDSDKIDNFIFCLINLGILLPVRYRTIKNFYDLKDKNDIYRKDEDLEYYLFIEELDKAFTSLDKNRMLRELDRVSILIHKY